MIKRVSFLVLGAVALVMVALMLNGCVEKVRVNVDSTPVAPEAPSFVLNVYVENSGSMDGYMINGSQLKDAVYDYVSDLSRLADATHLNYINTQIIPQQKNLNAFIRTLNPATFAQAGGNRANTDLSKIFEMMLEQSGDSVVSLFVSDCILDIPASPTGFFGDCQVTMKNIINEARKKDAGFAVEVVRLESNFSGWWYCGKNKAKLDNVKRPYYIWVMGNKDVLANIRKTYPVESVMHGIKQYCAFVPSQNVPSALMKEVYQVPNNGKIVVEALLQLNGSLQANDILCAASNYRTSDARAQVLGVQKITAEGSQFSHVARLEVANPGKLHELTLSVSQPGLPSWAEQFNDETGTLTDGSMDKTTGIKSLVKGVAEAYRDAQTIGQVKLTINKR